MSKLSISIMAHPSRQIFFGYLRDTIGDCTIPISVDDGCGIIENNRRAWKMYDPKADFHVVIQDDAIPCKNFKEKAEKILTDKSMAYNFYFGNRQKYKYLAELGMKKGHIISRWTSWGVAICLPTKIIPEMLEYTKTLKSRHDDTRIGFFLKQKGIKIYFPMPSLVDHRTGENSLVGDPSNRRKAWYFIDNDNKSEN